MQKFLKYMNRKNEEGFSLIELMIVVAIIGILAAIAIPNFQKFQAKSRRSEAKTLLGGLYTGMQAFAAEYTIYTSDFGMIGFEPTGDLRYVTGFANGTEHPTGLTTQFADYAGSPPNNFDPNTHSHCGNAHPVTTLVYGCELVYSPGITLDGTSVAGAVANRTFEAQSVGDIDGDATLDSWSINEGKNMEMINNDLNDDL